MAGELPRRPSREPVIRARVCRFSLLDFRSPQIDAAVEGLESEVRALQSNGLLTLTEKDELLPGREMSHTKLSDIVDVVRIEGETGSYRDPKWTGSIDALGNSIDSAVDTTLGDKTLSDLLDENEKP